MGWVSHQRVPSKITNFRYPIFNFLVPTNRLQQENFSFGCKWLFRIDSGDYIDATKKPLSIKIKNFLEKNYSYEADTIILQTIPKMFGYVFNPVSFWLCYRENTLDAVLCEVNNTFGDKHFYFISHQNQMETSSLISQGDLKTKGLTNFLKKEFHVSPFFPIQGQYQFKFQIDSHKSDIDINYFTSDMKPLLLTSLNLELFSSDAKSPLQIIFKYGWMTPLVILKIHIQAFRLWTQKIKFYHRPPPPKKETTP